MSFDHEDDGHYDVEFDELRVISSGHSIVQTFLFKDKIAKRIVTNLEDIVSTDVMEIEAI